MYKIVRMEAVTRKGSRKNNQDNFMLDTVIPYISKDCEKDWSLIRDEKIHIAGVSDGVGGAACGEVASANAMAAVSRDLKNHKESDDFVAFIRQMMDDVNEQILSVNDMLHMETAATLSLLLWKDDRFWAVNIGDSPIFLIRNGEIREISERQTAENWKKNHDMETNKFDKHTLANYVGKRGDRGSRMAHILEGRLEEHDIFLLCSDGVTDELNLQSIKESVEGERDGSLKVLFEKLSRTDMRDNCTAVRVSFEKIGMEKLRTEVMDRQLQECIDEDDYYKIMKEYHGSLSRWEEFVVPQIREKQLKINDISECCGVDRKTAAGFLKNPPTKRKNVIALGILLEKSLGDVNYMLSHEAGSYQLYPKNAEDAIWIYMIQHKTWKKGCGQSVKEMFEVYKKKYQKLCKEYIEKPLSQGTEVILEKIVAMDHFEQLMGEIIPEMTAGYRRLIAYIEEMTEKSGLSVASFCYQGDPGARRQMYYRELRKLKNDCEVPSRMFLIALGIHLGLTVPGINHMLQEAGMIPLYSKNSLESRLIFYLEDLYLKQPVWFTDYDFEGKCCDETDGGSVAEYLYRKLCDDERKLTGHPYEELLRLL